MAEPSKWKWKPCAFCLDGVTFHCLGANSRPNQAPKCQLCLATENIARLKLQKLRRGA